MPTLSNNESIVNPSLVPEPINKIKRENEEFVYSNFKVGSSYSKLDSMAISEVIVPKQARDITGITRFKNCVVLFVTLDKQDKEDAHKYFDTFLLNGKQFHWESQNSNTPATPHMKMIFNHKPVILFARVEQKIKGKTEPFIYVGQLSYVEYDYSVDNKDIPVEVIFDVTDYQVNANSDLSAIYHWESEEEREIRDTSAPDLLKKVRSSGQGRMVDAKKKKAIELHAMKVAREYYEHLGFIVMDTSSNCPYDLECFQDDKFRRVEVKGTMSKGDNVYVTSGEVIDAMSDECETDLFIVCNIKVKMPKTDQYDTSGNDIKVTENWKPEDKHLEPKTYKYHLPK